MQSTGQVSPLFRGHSGYNLGVGRKGRAMTYKTDSGSRLIAARMVIRFVFTAVAHQGGDHDSTAGVNGHRDARGCWMNQ